MSLGIAPKFTWPARAVLGAAFAVCTFMGIAAAGARERRARDGGAADASGDAIFVVRAADNNRDAERRGDSADAVQQRDPGGAALDAVSVDHELLPEERGTGGGRDDWKMGAYFVTLIAGGIALFIPGPWLVSVLLHYDFSTSFLIFLSLVNIHHFILDGQLWKLRDTRVASLLVDGKATQVANGAGAVPPVAARSGGKLALRIATVCVLFLWGGFEEVHFAMRNNDGNLNALERAARINPYDSGTQQRIARTQARDGKHDLAVAALAKAIEINPNSIALQQS